MFTCFHHHPLKTANAIRGFSLVELMIVVAIIGTVLGLAVPQYSDYLRRAKLTDGTALLANYRVSVEQYYQDNRNYGPVINGACGIAPPGNTEYFQFACTVGATDDTFTATASSKIGGGLGAANAYIYTVNQTNTRRTTGFKGQTVAKDCWLIRGDEC